MKKEIFVKIVDFLEKGNITYCILGNTSEYPTNIGSDVDIVIDSLKFTDIISIIQEFLTDSQFEVCNLLQHEVEGKCFIVSIIDQEKDVFEMLALDFCGDYMEQGKVILTEKKLLNSRKMINQGNVDFWVCGNDIAFVYYLVKKIEKQSLNLQQFQYLKKLWEEDRQSIMDQLHLRFNDFSCEKLTDIFDKEELTGFSSEFLKVLQRESQMKYGRSLKNQILEFKRMIYRFLNPTGLIISVLGCDGSGKSTVIDQLKSKSQDFEAFRGTEYHHLFATKKESSGKVPVSNPHEQVSRSWVMSNLKLMYFLFKYFYGYWLIAYPQKVRSKLVIFDRYYYDILVDPRRYRHNGSLFLTKFIGRIIPKPDLLFVIDAPAEILQQRKQEVSFEESKRQRQAYLDLKNDLAHVSIIDNIQHPKIAAFEIKKVMHDYLVCRFNKRYKL